MGAGSTPDSVDDGCRLHVIVGVGSDRERLLEPVIRDGVALERVQPTDRVRLGNNEMEAVCDTPLEGEMLKDCRSDALCIETTLLDGFDQEVVNVGTDSDAVLGDIIIVTVAVGLDCVDEGKEPVEE